MNKFVFFDVDNTLINGQTQKILAGFLFKNRVIGLLTFLKINLFFLFYKLKLIKDTAKIRKKLLLMFKGKKVTEIGVLFKIFFEEELKKAIYLESRKIIEEHIKDKDTVILISASLNNLLEHLKKYLGLDFLFATRLEIDGDVFTGKIEGEAVYGNNKIEIIKKFIQERNLAWKDVFVYTDHISDLELLEMVGHPMIVNPDKFLRRIAKKKRWIVYDIR